MFLTKEAYECKGTVFAADCEKEAEKIFKQWGEFRPKNPLPLKEIKRLNNITYWGCGWSLFEYLSDSNIVQIAFPKHQPTWKQEDTFYDRSYDLVAFNVNNIWIIPVYENQWDPYYGCYYAWTELATELDTDTWEVYDLPKNCINNISVYIDVYQLEIIHKGQVLLRLSGWTEQFDNPIKINNIRR